jgi:peptidyl-prolyl cis-trans isomerase A (cyclophilin A)
MNKPHLLCALHISALLAILFIPSTVVGNTIVLMQTDLGRVYIELFDSTGPTVATPLTVDNFMNYANDGDYDGTFIHRSVDDFVLQMGGFTFNPYDGGFPNNDGISHIPTDAPVMSEPGNSNLRGTIAMARLSGDPDSATSEFYFNLVDNSATLDIQNGGYTVFGQVLGNGMNVIDSLGALDTCGDIIPLIPLPCNQFPETPLIDMQSLNGLSFTEPIAQQNLIHIQSISTVPIPPTMWLFGSGLLGLVGIARYKKAV